MGEERHMWGKLVTMSWSSQVLTLIFFFVWPVLAERDLISLCLPENYEKNELPFPEKPNLVGISIDIDDVLRINDDTKTITFSTYFNVEWNERRLSLQPDFGASLRNPERPTDPVMVPMSFEITKDLWIPNILIYNLKTYKIINSLNRIEGLWIVTDKNVLLSQATHITFFCPMRFNMFPFDTHSCKFQVGSYSYDSSKMLFKTMSFGYSTKDNNSIALDYDIQIVPLKPENSILDYGAFGNFSLAGFEMVLTRHVSSYIFSYYIPSGLCVIVSWISFLIPMKKIPARMTLLVIILLALINIFNNVATNTPRAECLTAIEAWMIACILFVFAALLEYAGILLKKQQKHQPEDYYELQKNSPSDQGVTVQEFEKEYRRIDNFFLISFPLFFMVFNSIYWLVCIL